MSPRISKLNICVAAIVCLSLVQQTPRTEAQSTLLDYFLPIWPTVGCASPARTDQSNVTPSSGFTKYFNAVIAKNNQFSQTGLFFTGQCIQSFILNGVVECYFVFDKTSYITGLNTIKNTAPYPGVSLNFCALQLDDGPVKTSTICFDNSGIDPNHPYVIAKIESAAPEYNLETVMFGASVHDANSVPPQDFTFSYTCTFRQ